MVILGVGALVYANCGHKRPKIKFRVFLDYIQLRTGMLESCRVKAGLQIVGLFCEAGLRELHS